MYGGLWNNPYMQFGMQLPNYMDRELTAYYQANPRVQAALGGARQYADDVKLEGQNLDDAVQSGVNALSNSISTSPAYEGVGNIVVPSVNNNLQGIADAVNTGVGTYRAGKLEDERNKVAQENAIEQAEYLQNVVDEATAVDLQNAQTQQTSAISNATMEAMDDLTTMELENLGYVNDLMSLGNVGYDRETGKFMQGKGSILEGGEQRALFNNMLDKYSLDAKKFASFGNTQDQVSYLLAAMPDRSKVAYTLGLRELTRQTGNPVSAKALLQLNPAIGDQVLEDFATILVNSLEPVRSKKSMEISKEAQDYIGSLGTTSTSMGTDVDLLDYLNSQNNSQ